MKTTVSINEMINQSLIPSIKLMNGMDTRQAEAFCGGGRSRHPERGPPSPGPGGNRRVHRPPPAGKPPGGGGRGHLRTSVPVLHQMTPSSLKKKKTRVADLRFAT